MSGKPWTAERRAQFSAAMTQRWKRGDYAKRKPAEIDPTDRAARSARMRKLNFCMSYDETLKAKCVRGQVRVRRSPAYRAVQSAVLTEIMARPGMRHQARLHCIQINKNPRTRKRQWATRRRRATARRLSEMT